MKYSKNNQPLVCMMTNSTCYKGTKEFAPKGILWHSTGANNPSIARYVQPYESDKNYSELMSLLGKNKYKNDWNHIYLRAGVNAFIGNLANGEVATVQTLPWNYAPWGCGKGAKGTCNDTHIQFEICEASLTDKTYFNKVYKEACELTAYLCDMYDIDPYGTIMLNGVKVPTILCHYDSYNLGLGSNHGDVLHWFKKHGKTMDDVRKDVAALMNKPAKALYRIRKTWSDAASQKGAFTDLNNAKKACDAAGSAYYVFDESGKVVYPVVTTTSKFKAGDEVKLASDAKYTNGKSVPKWVIKSKLYVREIQGKNVVISTVKTGDITGVVDEKYLTLAPVVTFNVGDKVKLVSGAKYTNGKTVPIWVSLRTLYVRELQGSNVAISTVKTGDITGVVSKSYLKKA